MSDFLLVLGVFVLAFSLLTVRHRLVRKLGALTILLATFLAGWFLTGQPWVGVAAAAGWFLLPWLEILLRVRRILIPMQRELGYQYPPNRDLFPALPEVTDEIERLGFEKTDDTGWRCGEFRQFFRLFHHPEKHQLATISLFDQGGVVLTFVSLSNRTADGKTLITWNYPFTYGLKFAPRVKLMNAAGADGFEELQAIHEEFLESQSDLIIPPRGSDPESPWLPYDADEVVALVESEMNEQLRHNLDLGLLQKVSEDQCRYSWRGCFYLWRQCVKDMVRQ